MVIKYCVSVHVQFYIKINLIFYTHCSTRLFYFILLTQYSMFYSFTGEWMRNGDGWLQYNHVLPIDGAQSQELPVIYIL